MPKPVDVTTPSDREIAVARVFDAPRELIWDCHTKPELLKRWMLGPLGWSMPVCEIDLRVGGAYRYRWRNDATTSNVSCIGTAASSALAFPQPSPLGHCGTSTKHGYVVIISGRANTSAP